jgi:hypothetical protein
VRVLLGAAAVAALTGVAAGAAAGRWGGPKFVSADGWMATDALALAVDRQGEALLVWEACDLATAGCYHQVQARTLTRRGRLGPVVNVSELGPAVALPKAASDDHGDTVVAWEQHDTHTNWRIAARRVGRNGSLGSILMLTPDGAIGSNPQVAVAASGRALVVWTEYQASAASGSWSTVARNVFAGGSVGPRIELGGGSPEAPAVAIDRRGVAVVAWTDYTQVFARRIGPRGVTPLRVLASGRSSRGGPATVRVTVDNNGDTAVSFRQSAGKWPGVFLRHWRRGGSLGPLLAVSPPRHENGFHHSLASEADGDSIVFWTRALPGDRFAVYGRSVSRTGRLGRVVDVGHGDFPDVALADDGDGVAVWHYPDDDVMNAVRISTISAATMIGRPRKLATNGRFAQAAAAPGGRVVVVWQLNFAPNRIQAAARD